MPRYFIEVSYKGTCYAGFQVQQNANTIQAEVEKALAIYFKKKAELTGSSRTDAGVHAFQNFFHFDFDGGNEEKMGAAIYHLNAILPEDIVANKIYEVRDEAHCRFDARERSYRYSIYKYKDPFLRDRAYYYPYKLDFSLLEQAAEIISNQTCFESFSKRNTQVHNFNCTIIDSHWEQSEIGYSYHVTANRFLRGMVRGLVGTMLKVGRNKFSMDEFEKIFEARNPFMVDFSVPPQGLTLIGVQF